MANLINDDKVMRLVGENEPTGRANSLMSNLFVFNYENDLKKTAIDFSICYCLQYGNLVKKILIPLFCQKGQTFYTNLKNLSIR